MEKTDKAVSVTTSGASAGKLNGTYLKPTRPVLYQCLKCGEHFPANYSEQN